MDKWHLYSDFENGVNTGGAVRQVKVFGVIGLFVLLLACINFMNLSTARSEKRAREVGVRKTIGSGRSQLISQFLSESTLVVLFSFALAILLAQLLMPFFNQLTEKSLHIPWTHWEFWVVSLAFIFFHNLVHHPGFPVFQHIL